MNIGKTIKVLRTASGISQKEFASRLEISASYLSLIESNERELNVSLLRQISRELGVPASAFFFDAEDATVSSALDQRDEQRNVQGQFSQILQRLLTYEEDFGSSSVAKKHSTTKAGDVTTKLSDPQSSDDQ